LQLSVESAMVTRRKCDPWDWLLLMASFRQKVPVPLLGKERDSQLSKRKKADSPRGKIENEKVRIE
jgi:hypothetical protein